MKTLEIHYHLFYLKIYKKDIVRIQVSSSDLCISYIHNSTGNVGNLIINFKKDMSKEAIVHVFNSFFNENISGIDFKKIDGIEAIRDYR